MRSLAVLFSCLAASSFLQVALAATKNAEAFIAVTPPGLRSPHQRTRLLTIDAINANNSQKELRHVVEAFTLEVG